LKYAKRLLNPKRNLRKALNPRKVNPQDDRFVV
jgi:hypothetical protein